MNVQDTPPNIAAALATEHPRLVRLCSILLGDADAAEDAAQETLIEAWRNAHKLRDVRGVTPWLNAIARNVCARWTRRRGQAWARTLESPADGTPSLSWDTSLEAPVDIEVELEREQLAQLLDRALALLPAETRTILVSHLITETPHADIAAQLGMTEGSVAVRLHRGKLALRRILEQQYAAEAAAYGVAIADADGWHPTRIWCPFCGEEKLDARINHDTGFANFKCPTCFQITGTRRTGLFHGLKNPKAILSRQIEWLNEHYRTAIATNDVPCWHCGTPTQAIAVTREMYPDLFDQNSLYGLYVFCPACKVWDLNGLRYLALDLPVTQRFWRDHPRMRIRPEYTVHRDNRLVHITTFESVTDAHTLDILSAADTLEVVEIVNSSEKK